MSKKKLGINETANRAHSDAIKLGWYDHETTKTILESLMMVNTELCEAVEELRNNKFLKYYPHSDDSPKFGKPEGLPVEIADAIIRLLDLGAYLGYDLESIIDEKLRYNLTRGQRHGNKPF